jgi:hypothetical protein
MPAEFGPPAVPIPVHELIGGHLVAAGKLADAAAEYAASLALQPGRSATLLGSARTESSRGRADAVQRAYRALAENWREADADVAGLAEVRAQAAGPRNR